MRNDHDDELTPRERRLLDSLPREATPPAALEERVVAGLKAEGMIGSRSTLPRQVAVAATLALAVTLSFFAGSRFASSRVDGNAPSPASTDPLFALLVYDPPGETPGDMSRAAVIEATEWVDGLTSGGSFLTGAKLVDIGSRLALRGERVTSSANQPAIGGSLVLGGFFMIRAADHDDAARIAATCPLLRYGSTIEVRAVDDT